MDLGSDGEYGCIGQTYWMVGVSKEHWEPTKIVRFMTQGFGFYGAFID